MVEKVEGGMSFIQHAASCGLILDHVVADGRWHRVKTIDKPRKRNGAYLFDGRKGVVRNWATMHDYATYREDGTAQRVSMRDYREALRSARARQEHRYADARIIAEDMLKRAAWVNHPYLARKGFPDEFVWVLEDELLVPMRDFKSNALNSLQRITQNGEKRFLPGGKAKGSVLRLGASNARERWLCEGYATGLSVREALRDLRRSYQVIVAFSAGNLAFIAEQVPRPAFVMADNDSSRTGETTAIATGLPWVMPPDLDTDANDMHERHGLRALVKLLRDLRAG